MWAVSDVESGGGQPNTPLTRAHTPCTTGGLRPVILLQQVMSGGRQVAAILLENH